MTENTNLKAAGEDLVRLCMEGVRQNDLRQALMLTYTQAVLTQETLQGLVDTLKAQGALNGANMDKNTEKAFRKRCEAMRGSGLILPPTAATPKVNGT